MTSKLTRERLQEIAEDGFLKHGESKVLARMALAATDGDVAVLPLYRHAQPSLVPDKMIYQDGVLFVLNNDMSSIERGTVAMRAWNACRAAMLQAGKSPVIPEGYVMVPIDLLSELRDWAHPEIEKYCEMWKGRRDGEFPALRKVIADADAMLAAAPQEAQVVPEKIEQSRKRVDRCDVCTEGARGGCGTCIFNGNFE